MHSCQEQYKMTHPYVTRRAAPAVGVSMHFSMRGASHVGGSFSQLNLHNLAEPLSADCDLQAFHLSNGWHPQTKEGEITKC
eukprot:1155930-Pelagomonas_calceolata.AAC.1